ncbi:MAG: exodeoxyribonuclease VII large subunit, partial [Kocuria sp.]|nr:exodeoxyribonuclease VII large subunit [Kocuria sp.]
MSTPTSPQPSDAVDVPDPHRELAQFARDTSPENPWPLARLSSNLNAWIKKAPDAWVEGQVIEVNHRARVSYVTLRDMNEEMSVSVTLFGQEMAALQRPLEQ